MKAFKVYEVPLMEIPSKGKGFRVDEVRWSKLFRYILVNVKSIDADFLSRKSSKAKAKSEDL